MRNFLVLIASLLVPAVSIAAGEARLGAGLFIGAAEIEDDFGDELTAELQSTRFFGTYYFGESGPFLGIGLGKETADDIEINGQDAGVGSIDADTRGLTVGYRTGTLGEPQLLFSVALVEIEPDGGGTADATVISFGVERDFGNGRFTVVGNYSDGDDESSFGGLVGGTYYLTKEFGLFAQAQFASGETDLGGADADTSEFELGLGVELRFLTE